MLTRQAVLAAKVRTEMESRNATQSHVIEDLAAMIESRDTGNDEHVGRTKKYVGRLTRAMQNDPAFRDEITDHLIDEIENAAPLHDVGKIAISDTILLKPGKLTKEEFEIVKTHTTKGSEMIRRIFSNLDDPHFLEIAEEIALSHHEKWNGTGYPEGLSGTDIPLPARIMAVADVYDALISERVYKKAMDPKDALQVLYSESGEHFDPDIIRILKENGGPLLLKNP